MQTTATEARRLAYTGLAAYLLLPLVAAVVATVAGCGGAQSPRDMQPRKRAQWVAAAGAEAVESLDRLADSTYARTADSCLPRTESWAEYDACMKVAVKLKDSVLGARDTILTLQDSLDASVHGRSGPERDWYRAVQCVGDSLGRVGHYLEQLGEKVPPLVGKVIDVADSFTGSCRSAPELTSGGSQ